MQHQTYQNTSLNYTNYSGKVMEDYGEKDIFDTELAKYPITELYKGYDHIVSIIREATLKIVMKKESINREEIRRKYLEYVNSLQSVEFRYGNISETLFGSKQDKSLNRCYFHHGSVLDIPISIKIYCLCLGISINQYREYNEPCPYDMDF